MKNEIKNLCSHLSNRIRATQSELSKEERRLANFIEFIAERRKSNALGEALEGTERRASLLQTELNDLRNTRDRIFKAPPIEWTEAKLENARALLENKFSQSSKALR